MNKMLCLFILLLVIMIAGCGKKFVCNPPYIAYQDKCCLDKDSNDICDKDEIVKELIQEADEPEEEIDEEEEIEDASDDEEADDEEEEETSDDEEEDDSSSGWDEADDTDSSSSSSSSSTREVGKVIMEADLVKVYGEGIDGSIEVIEFSDGRQKIRLSDDFKVVIGRPQLYPYLTTKNRPSEKKDFKGALELSPVLRKFKGPYNFAVPDGKDVSDYEAFALYDEPFRKVYGYANLD